MFFDAEEIVNTTTYQVAVSKTKRNPYRDSPFKIFQDMSSKTKSVAFEKLADELLSKTYQITPRTNSDHDTVVNGKKVEVKGSMGWVVDGEISHYRFQQIRDQDYDIVLFMYFTPEKLILEAATKLACWSNLHIQNSKGEWIHNQHGGKKVNSGTFFVDTMPGELSWVSSIEECIMSQQEVVLL